MVRARGQERRHTGSGGFTLIELIVVVSIIGILVGIALPNYRATILQAKEAVLKEDLFRFRDSIDQYQADKGKYPASLDALVTDGYLRGIPKDPITGGKDWLEVPAEPEPGATDSPGIYDVHSGSDRTASDGSPYNEW
jgi:general secretion pathway protein G